MSVRVNEIQYDFVDPKWWSVRLARKREIMKLEGTFFKARTAKAREEGKSARFPLRNFVVTVQILYAVQYLIQ